LVITHILFTLAWGQNPPLPMVELAVLALSTGRSPRIQGLLNNHLFAPSWGKSPICQFSQVGDLRHGQAVADFWTCG